ncbi:MAG: alpha-L-fucosidase [Lentisphaeria bacterium]|nr:alpha-L-fucosidase [Lentisphaeria bacterium]
MSPFETNKERFVGNRFGMFIHWGLYAMGARHEWLKKAEKMTSEEYQKYFDHFDPDLYDPTAWAKAAKNAGMKYMVITTKHHEGFCLWDSKVTDYNATNTPYGKDLLRPMVDAFRAEGLRVCLYFSLIDWYHEHYTIDQMHPLARAGEEPANENRDMAKYRSYMFEQVREIMTNYGEIDMLWVDFSFDPAGPFAGKNKDDWGSEELVEMIRELQPGIMINNRLGLDTAPDFVTPEQYQAEFWPVDEDGNRLVWEACQTFSGSWGYHRDEDSWKDLRTLLWLLIDSVSKGGNLLLNVGPTGRGELDYRALDRLEGIGSWMKSHSRSIYGCTASDYTPPPNCSYTQNGNRLYLHFYQWPIRMIKLDGLKGMIKYAQLLNDASEIIIDEKDFGQIQTEGIAFGENFVRLQLPPNRPPVEIPVIELFLRDEKEISGHSDDAVATNFID